VTESNGRWLVVRPLAATAAAILAIGIALAASGPSSVLVRGTVYADEDGATTCHPSVSAVEHIRVSFDDGSGNSLGVAVTGRARVTAGSRTSKLMTEFPTVRCWAQATFSLQVPAVSTYLVSPRGPVALPSDSISFAQLAGQGFHVAIGEGSVFRAAERQLSGSRS